MATYAGDTSSSAKTNYARLGHASHSLIPKLLQQLLLFYEPTNKILKDCLHNSYLKNKLNANEWIDIRNANTNGYEDFDIPLIYKLLRNLKLIPPPTRGWEPKGGPMITETTIGDDLERFRKSRNEISHRGNTNVSDEELTEYFTQFKDIAQRLELVLNKKKNELVSEFQNLETCCMDDISEQILANLAKKEKEFTLPNEISEYLMSLISNAKSTDSRTLIKKPLQDVCCVEGEIACLSCEIIEDETAVTWYKDDAEIIPSTDIILKMDGKIHELSIPRTEMKDGGRYSIKVKQSTSEAKLTVKALISNHLVDTTCLEGSTIVLSCEVSVEGMGGIWYKDDSIVVKSNQIYPTVNSRIHQLNIFQSEIKDGGKYVFKIRDKISSAILTVKAVITKHLENVTCIEDQSLSLVCELAEKDISVTWLKDGKVIEASKNIVPEIHNNAHILKFKKLSKNDGGKYALMARGKETEAVVLVKAKSTIPDQILQMDEKDKEMYLEIIKSGTERRYYIRLMIVGENGVGKTCLMRRLLGEDIDDVTSTDGIDIIIRKCKIRLSDGKWILNKEDTVEQDRNVRMKRALTDKDSILQEAKRRDNRAEPLLEDVPMETTVTPFGNVKGEEIKNVTEIKDIYTGKVMDQKNDVDMQFTNELEEESIAESVPLHTDKDVTLKSEKRVGLLNSLSDVMNVELPKEFFADCDVWDFAGQKEFYATHQTFLTNSAIYLLTADLSKDLSSQIQTKICDVDFGKVGCYIDFWFDTIHCYATTEAPDQSVDKPMSDKLKPPIIIVCTGTDKIKGELCEQKTLFVKQLSSILNEQSKRKHITSIQYLSNKEPLEKDFVELQSAIFETATEMSSWGKELPLRWIHLETALDGERDAGSNILPFHLVVKLAKDSSLPTSDNEEIILFLRYQHECGHVIFFKDLPDYIILNPRWLIDAFKCFVSAHQFQGTLLYLDDWKELEETGRLTTKLISKLFEKVPKLKFMEYKEHLLHVLEKFDIIVKPNNIENMTSYYMPCMIKSSSFDVICHNFGVHLPSCHRTSWLLLEFEFLPPAFFNHVLVGYIRQFKVSTESTENGRRLSLYRGIGVFDIVEKGCTKLVICADTNLIAFQIWIYDKKINSTFHDFRHTLTNMVDMLSERYQICCKYKVKLKCSESDYQKAEGRYEYCYKDDKMKSYFCPEHQSGHECLDVFKYWFSDKVDVDGLVIKEEEQDVKTATIEFLKIKLEEDGLHFRGSIPDDGNSFFKACSDQLQRLEIPGHTHTELRQMVIPTLKFCSENEIKSANFTSDTWKLYIDKVAEDKENVEDIVVETMAKLLRKQIIVYSKSYRNEIFRKKFNEDANGTPLLLAKDKLYYQSLERRHGTPSRLQESNISSEYTVRIQKNYYKLVHGMSSTATIVDQLLSDEVLSTDDSIEILSKVIPSEMNRNLIEKIRDRTQYDKFIAALRDDSVNAELADDIEQTDVTEHDMESLQSQTVVKPGDIHTHIDKQVNIKVPIIELKGHAFNVDEGKSVAIECNEFIIDEKPFWEWIHEDDETNKLTIREDKKDKYLLKSDPPYLWILNAEMSDRGYYRCCIEYSTSNGEEIVRSKKAHLIVEKAVKPGDIHTHIDKQVNIKDSSPSGPPEKKKLVDPDQLKLIKEDEGNKILWNEAKEFTKEGAQYPEGYLEAQAKKEEEAGEVTKKEKRKRDDKDSSPSGPPEKKKLVDPDQLKLIKEDEGNKILWNEAKEFTKEGAQYPEGYLEAQAKKEEEAGEVTKKEKRKRDDNDSSPSGTPEKKKLVDYKIDPDQLKLIKEDEGNKILWNEAKEFTKEGAQAVEELNVVDIHGKTSFTGRAQKKAEGQAEWKDKSERINRVNLYVKNLDDNIDVERLRKEFSQFGTITSAKVETKDGRSKGFGYVCFHSPEEATKAITEMNGRTVDGKTLYVSFLQRKEDRKVHLALQRSQVDGLVTKEEEQVYSPEFTEALSRYDETVGLADLEEKLILSFANGDSWREWRKKTSFNYLLLDPRVTKNLPSRMGSLGKLESFKVFVAAIFYVGKGQIARPFRHLHEAISQMEKTQTRVSEKVKYILDIWSDNVGVVSLQCFQNAIPEEACTREACMLDAIFNVGVNQLTNQMRGTYYGISRTWSRKEKSNMGFYFLKKALKIFKEEGERPLLPVDLKGGQ